MLTHQVDLQRIHPPLQLRLPRHLRPPHQLGALGHDGIHHHRRDGHHGVALGIVGRELAVLGLAF